MQGRALTPGLLQTDDVHFAERRRLDDEADSLVQRLDLGDEQKHVWASMTERRLCGAQ